MLTLSVRSFQTPPTPFTWAWPPSLPSVPTSFATRVTSPAKELSWSTMVLMVSFSSRISPFTSTVIFFERSPFATAVVTSAMLRTWPVRFAAMRLTLSVRSFQVPATPFTLAWPPSLPFRPDLARDARHLGGEGAELADHRVHDLADAQELAAERAAVDLELHGLRQVALGDGADHARDLRRRLDEVADHRVHRIDALGPAAGGGRELAALADLAFLADHPRDAVELAVEPLVQLGDVVEGLRDLAGHPGEIERQAGGEIPFSEGPEGFEEGFGIELRYAGLDLLHEFFPLVRPGFAGPLNAVLNR